MATTYRSLEIVPGESGYGRKYVWQAPVRLAHWINALLGHDPVPDRPVHRQSGAGAQRRGLNHFVMGRVREIHFVAGYALLFAFLLRDLLVLLRQQLLPLGLPVRVAEGVVGRPHGAGDAVSALWSAATCTWATTPWPAWPTRSS
jgi:hypothetical protein